MIQLIAEGRPNRKIAEVLSISVKSVEMHRASALKKLNADSTAALIRYAIKNKLVEGMTRPAHTAYPASFLGNAALVFRVNPGSM